MTYRSKAHLAFVRARACCWCRPGEQKSPTQASHHGPHGTAHKAPDTSCIPLCEDCHRHWTNWGTLPETHMTRENLDAWATAQALVVCTDRIVELEGRKR